MDLVIVVARVALSLAAVLGLLVFLQRRITRGSKRRVRTATPLEVVARTGVGSKASVVVIDVDGRRFVLGVTEQNINVLHSGERTPVVDPSTTDDEFQRVLADAAFDAGPAAAAAPDDLPTRASVKRANPPALAGSGSILSRETWRATAAFLRQDR
ncbi:flagellar biosynthetic protein FliO [Leifsonia sp. YIM 134122]|uniref:Flagellar biosynthetic protein FliO n=1 Tax=Leifsonia stereocauli TaxID=3134136 RepID=A0ABU9W2I3_9MICO